MTSFETIEVDLTGITDGDLLEYSASSGKFLRVTKASIIGSSGGGASVTVQSYATNTYDLEGQSTHGAIPAGSMFIEKGLSGLTLTLALKDIPANSTNLTLDTDYTQIDGDSFVQQVVSGTLSGLSNTLDGLTETGTQSLILADSNGKLYTLTVGTDGSLLAVAQPQVD